MVSTGGRGGLADTVVSVCLVQVFLCCVCVCMGGCECADVSVAGMFQCVNTCGHECVHVFVRGATHLGVHWCLRVHAHAWEYRSVL